MNCFEFDDQGFHPGIPLHTITDPTGRARVAVVAGSQSGRNYVGLAHEIARNPKYVENNMLMEARPVKPQNMNCFLLMDFGRTEIHSDVLVYIDCGQIYGWDKPGKITPLSGTVKTIVSGKHGRATEAKLLQMAAGSIVKITGEGEPIHIRYGGAEQGFETDAQFPEETPT